MLEKKPDNRPYVKEVVKSDYVKGHISRLLSHTIKVGNGGVVPTVNAQLAQAENLETDLEKLSLEEIERGIELERNKQREEIKKKNDAEAKVLFNFKNYYYYYYYYYYY